MSGTFLAILIQSITEHLMDTFVVDEHSVRPGGALYGSLGGEDSIAIACLLVLVGAPPLVLATLVFPPFLRSGAVLAAF